MRKNAVCPYAARFTKHVSRAALAVALFLSANSCSLPGWNSNLEQFVETGFSMVYLDSSSYVQGSGQVNADVRSGSPVTVTVKLNNPKNLELAYSVSADEKLVQGAIATPTTSTADYLTTVVFQFTPTIAAECKDIPLSIGVSSPSLNRTYDSVGVTVHCDSPPTTVTNLKAGIKADGKACIGFTLPEDTINADIAKVEITYTSDTLGTKNTVTKTVSRTGSDLTTVPTPALLDSNTGKYVRYFIPDDVAAKNQYSFTVKTIDASGKSSDASSAVSVQGTETYLGYDANGGEGTVGAQFGYNTNSVTVAQRWSIARSGYAFTAWNTNADGTGTDYQPGASFTLGTENTTLYAKWLELGRVTVSLADPSYSTLSFSPSSATVQSGTSFTVTGAGTLATSGTWSWSVDGAAQSGSASSFTWSTTGASIGAHTVSCQVVYGGITYSGSVIVTVTPQYTVSYDGNGNTAGSAPATQSFSSGASVTLTSTVGTSFAKSGYAFAGWGTSASGAVVYADGETTGALTANLNLYAIWTNVAPNPVTNLAATSGERKITLTWTDPPAATDGDLDHVTITISAEGIATTTQNVAAGIQQCVVKNLVRGRLYSFTATAYDKAGNAQTSPVPSVSKMPYLAMTAPIASGTVAYTQTDNFNTPHNCFTNTLSAYRIGKYEVTYEQWYEVYTWAKANGYTFSNLLIGAEGSAGSAGSAPTANRLHPVQNITWGDAVVWCNALSEYQGLTPCYYTDAAHTTVLKDAATANSTVTLYSQANVDWTASGYRLPTESEWEYAASNAGQTPWNYASGATGYSASEASAVANTGATMAVGSLQANAFGIYDMSGNVCEWLWDWNANYPTTAQTDYRGPDSGTTKLCMGGAWAGTYDVELRIGERRVYTTQLGIGGGFRVCRTGGN